MLPALLAGAGILLVAGLFIFGGNDEKEADKAKDQQTATADAQKANRNGGVGSRPTDDASESARPQPKLNPRIANAIVTEGMAPSPNKKQEPTSFASTDEEIAYWEEELRSAEQMLDMRERAAEMAPATAEKIRENGTPEEIAQIERRLEVVNDNLEKAKARVAEVEGKLEKLRGG
jgi:chromosome segregation ATPase